MKRISTVAIIGKPNSGKSTLFNRIVGSRKAITHETPGVTRDRIEETVNWNGVEFRLVDTGGFIPGDEDPLQSEISERIRRTVAEASVIIFLVDVDTGVTAEDDLLLRELKRDRDRMILAVNKVENMQDAIDANEFYSMGFSGIHPISALHGRGIGDLLDEVVARLPRKPAPRQERTDIKIAIIGKPNVGKSSLVNALTGEKRHIVAEEPGTTRDTINLRLKHHGREVVIVDTAGVKRRSRTERGLDSISSLKSIRSVEDSDVVLVMVDGSDGSISRQDTRIAAVAHRARKGIIVLVNKWDIVEKDERTVGEYVRKVREGMPFLAYAPVITVSATEGTRVGKIIPACFEIQKQRRKKIPTPRLNEALEEAVASNPPKFHKTGTGRVYYGTQTGTEPPAFTLFVNKTSYFPRSYIRYLNNKVRKRFTFDGTAIRIILKSRE